MSLVKFANFVKIKMGSGKIPEPIFIFGAE
jgi:hypothetical protein